MVTKQLGVSEEQAKGGTGLLFKMAKEKLAPEEFGKVSGAVPGVNDLISSAPAPSGAAGAISGMAGALGGGAGQLGNIAGLASGFKNLNLDSGMVGKFIPIVLSFVQLKGGDAAKGALEKVLK
jgi:hypothetical protein